MTEFFEYVAWLGPQMFGITLCSWLCYKVYILLSRGSFAMAEPYHALLFVAGYVLYFVDGPFNLLEKFFAVILLAYAWIRSDKQVQ